MWRFAESLRKKSTNGCGRGMRGSGPRHHIRQQISDAVVSSASSTPVGKSAHVVLCFGLGVFLLPTIVVLVERWIGCVCVCIQTITVKRNDRWPRYLASWFILILSRSGLIVKVIGQSSWSQEEAGVQELRVCPAWRSEAKKQILWKTRPEFKTVNKQQYLCNFLVGWKCCWSGRCDLEWMLSSRRCTLKS